MEQMGLKKLDTVDLISHFNGEKRIAETFVTIPYNIPRKCTATYFPEANVLVAIKNVAHTSNTPASKTVVISIEKKSN